MALSIPPARSPVPWWTIAQLLAAPLVLFAFLGGIRAMGVAFKGMGAGLSENLVGIGVETGPVVCLFVGILATTLVQSSSTTTSLAVGLVAAGALPFEAAIYMVMGANVGTTVTNTIVSLGHITRSQEYHRAFAAATVHDFFNIVTLLVIFPLEIFTGFLTWIADKAAVVFQGVGATRLADPIKIVTEPLIQLLEFVTLGNPVALAIAGILLTFVALYFLVKLLKSLAVSRFETLFDRTVFRSAPIALAFGLVLTVIVQSSSVTTSLVVPLVGAGVLKLKQAYPYTLGANIGTTFTAVLAALAAYSLVAPGEVDPGAEAGLRLAFHHVFFNVCGVALLWPLRAIPIGLAQGFARLARRNRSIPVIYIIVAFYIIPFFVVWLGR